MSLIKKLSLYEGQSETTLNGVEESECTYEIFDGILILRTTTSDVIHINRRIGKELIKIILDEVL